MRKKKSGGKRAVEKKHRERQAARARSGFYAADWQKRYEQLGGAPVREPDRAHQWIADVVLLAMEEAMQDQGMPPEARREQIARLAAQAAKVIDPAKLAARIEALEEALEESNARTLTPPEVGTA